MGYKKFICYWYICCSLFLFKLFRVFFTQSSVLPCAFFSFCFSAFSVWILCEKWLLNKCLPKAASTWHYLPKYSKFKIFDLFTSNKKGILDRKANFYSGIEHIAGQSAEIRWTFSFYSRWLLFIISICFALWCLNKIFPPTRKLKIRKEILCLMKNECWCMCLLGSIEMGYTKNWKKSGFRECHRHGEKTIFLSSLVLASVNVLNINNKKTVCVCAYMWTF